MPTNDNDHTQPSGAPDAEGKAALLLVESLIHGLCEQRTLSIAQAVAIADRAADVQRDHAEAADGAGASMWRSHGLLGRIAASLRADDTEAPRPGSPA